MNAPQPQPTTKNSSESDFSSTITTKGQVTIPRMVREHLGVKPADRVEFTIREGIVMLQKPQRLSLEDVFGAVTPVSRPEDFKARRDVAIEEHIEKGRALTA